MSLGRKWLWAGWLVVAALSGAAGTVRSWAQAPTTTVQDTITDASGAPAAGTVVVSWAAFTTAAGQPVAAGSLSTALGTGGTLSVALLPNAGTTPMGSYYTAVYHLSDGTTSREFWVVPVTGSGTVKLAAIRNQVLPTSMAVQTVSKAYVDTTVAKAMAGAAPAGDLPYVLKSGDTLLGPLTLAADPTQALQAADKHYVDAAVAGVSGSAPTTGQFPAVGLGNGSVAAPSLYKIADATNGFSFRTDGVQYSFGGAGQFLFANGNVFGLSSGIRLGFSPGDITSTGSDVFLARTAAGTLAVLNASAAPGALQAASFHESLSTPASSAASCSAGDFTDDANFHYVCVSDSTWKRVALSSF